MATYPLVIPRLGEAVIEATLTRWLKKEGDPVNAEEPVAEIATDKVDSEIVSPVTGVVSKLIAKAGEVIPVGQVIAELETETVIETAPSSPPVRKESPAPTQSVPGEPAEPSSTRFYSPLVRSIARQENISFGELDSISGSGSGDRVTKQDLMQFIETRNTGRVSTTGDTVIEMDRIRQLISAHMLKSVQTSPHVTSFTEIDMTRIVKWREQHKDEFQQKHGEKLTFTPVILEAIARSVKDHPMINVSVDGTRIIRHHSVHIGMAVALPTGNLIVPVIRDAEKMNLFGMIRSVNDLGNRARENKLVPDEITGGTISLTNLGSFGTLMGTPIINQPQCAIVAVGTIRKRPVVIETPEGDDIAVRSMMIASVTYDHRVIDGVLAGRFLNSLVKHLEQFDTKQTF